MHGVNRRKSDGLLAVNHQSVSRLPAPYSVNNIALLPGRLAFCIFHHIKQSAWSPPVLDEASYLDVIVSCTVYFPGFGSVLCSCSCFLAQQFLPPQTASARNEVLCLRAYR